MRKINLAIRDKFGIFGKISPLITAYLALSIIFYGFFWMTVKNMYFYLGLLEEKVEIVAFLSDKISEQQRVELVKKIELMEQVDKVKYTSKESALEELKKDMDFASQIKILNENPLPAMLDIYLKKKDPDSIKELAAKIQSLEGIEDLSYGIDEASRISMIGAAAQLLIRWWNILFVTFIVSTILIAAFAVSKKNLLFGMADGFIGGVFGVFVMWIVYKSVFAPLFSKAVFINKYEIVSFVLVSSVIGLIIRIPKNALVK